MVSVQATAPSQAVASNDRDQVTTGMMTVGKEIDQASPNLLNTANGNCQNSSGTSGEVMSETTKLEDAMTNIEQPKSSIPIQSALVALVVTLGISSPVMAQKSPGRNQYDAVTVQRGFTQDTQFSNWASGNSSQQSGGSGGQNSSKGSGRSKYGAITLNRGVTQDQQFSNWASGTSAQTGTSVSVRTRIPTIRVPTVHVH
jgi:hypothetical protein